MQLVQLRLLLGILLLLTPSGAAMWDPRYENVGSMDTKNIEKVLKSQIFGMSINKEAMNAFLAQNFAAFDAAVGDNLCQVRAHAFVTLSLQGALAKEEVADMSNKVAETSGKLSNISKKISEILKQNKKEAKVLAKKLKESTLSNFLREQDRDFVVPVFTDDVRGLILNYFVARFCHFNDKKAQELLDKLIAQSDLSKAMARNLISWARVELNAYSLRYLQKVSDRLLIDLSQSDDTNQTTNELFRARLLQQGLAQQVKNKLWTTPSTFIAMAVLLKDILLNALPVALRVKTICSQGMHIDMLMCSVRDNHFVWQQDGQKITGPLFVIEGVSNPAGNLNDLDFDCLEERMNILNSHEGSTCDQQQAALKALRNLDLNDIILANAAMHRQFLDPQVAIDFSSIKDLEAEYEMFKTKALALGLCKENTSCFRIIHIFPAKLNDTTK